MGVIELVRRQGIASDPEDWWYYSTTAFVLKWVIAGLIVLGVGGYFFGGYSHARRRMRKGLEPLPYHRWMISRNQREAFYHANPQLYNPYVNTLSYQAAYGHHLQTYQPPPPAYHEPEQVPTYSAAPNKTNPDQTYAPPTYPPTAYNMGVPQGSGPSMPPARQ